MDVVVVLENVGERHGTNVRARFRFDRKEYLFVPERINRIRECRPYRLHENRQRRNHAK